MKLNFIFTDFNAYIDYIELRKLFQSKTINFVLKEGKSIKLTKLHEIKDVVYVKSYGILEKKVQSKQKVFKKKVSSKKKTNNTSRQ